MFPPPKFAQQPAKSALLLRPRRQLLRIIPLGLRRPIPGRSTPALVIAIALTPLPQRTGRAARRARARVLFVLQLLREAGVFVDVLVRAVGRSAVAVRVVGAEAACAFFGGCGGAAGAGVGGGRAGGGGGGGGWVDRGGGAVPLRLFGVDIYVKPGGGEGVLVEVGGGVCSDGGDW